jgi:hypothetical protein
MRHRRRIVSVLPLLLLAGCGDGQSATTSTGSAQPSCEDITRFAERLVDVGIVYDYDPAPSPAALADRNDVVVAGTLSGGFDSGVGEVGPFVRYGVEVTDAVKGEAATGEEILVAVDYNQSHRSAEEYEEAIAAGAPVVVFANRSDDHGLIADIEGFMTACEGGEPMGWRGGWESVGSLDDVLAQAAGEDGAAAGIRVREDVLDGVRLWAHPDAGDGGGDDALVSGTVGYDPDGQCLYIEQGGVRYPVIWPHDAELVSADPLEIAAGGASGITIGTHVEGGGGYDQASSYAVDIPGSCLGPYDEVARINQQERITASTP